MCSPPSSGRRRGRWDIYGKELLRLKDRHNREFCLGPTHEEVITDLVKNEVTSYRQLPLTLYQIHIKFRDEIRPRFGVMRGSGIRDEGRLQLRHRRGRGRGELRKDAPGILRAYSSAAGSPSGRWRRTTGPIGGSFSHEFMVLADTGEDSIFSCNSCGYAASRDKAEIGRRDDGNAVSVTGGEPTKVATPGQRTVEEVTSFLKVRPEQLIKTLIFQQGDRVIAALIRGDHEINEVKLGNLLGAETVCLADDTAIEKATRAPRGFAGPVGLSSSNARRSRCAPGQELCDRRQRRGCASHQCQPGQRLHGRALCRPSLCPRGRPLPALQHGIAGDEQGD